MAIRGRISNSAFICVNLRLLLSLPLELLRSKKGLSAHQLGCFQHLFRGGADPVVLCQIDPADCTAGIEQEFRRAGDIVLIGSGFGVQQIVAPDDLGVGVREKGIGVTSLGGEIAGSLGRIDADGRYANSVRF